MLTTYLYKMKKLSAWFTGLATLFIAYSGGAQQNKNQSDKSLLWQISGKNMAKPSYLFGTIHLICKEDYVWTKKMQESLTKSDKVCFEIDMDDPQVMMKVATAFIDNSGKKLSDYFTREQYKLLTAYVKDSLGMDIAVFEHLKPIALQTVMSTTGTICANSTSYEDSIMKTALKDKKEIIGMEDPQEQIDLIDNLSTDSVVKELMDVIQNHPANDSELYKLIAAYKKQDLPALFELMKNSKEQSEDLGPFLDERNKKWIPRIKEKMQHSSVFFAVGAGHLYGPEGVINLLRKQGYTVKPLK